MFVHGMKGDRYDRKSYGIIRSRRSYKRSNLNILVGGNGSFESLRFILDNDAARSQYEFTE